MYIDITYTALAMDPRWGLPLVGLGPSRSNFQTCGEGPEANDPDKLYLRHNQ